MDALAAAAMQRMLMFTFVPCACVRARPKRHLNQPKYLERQRTQKVTATFSLLLPTLRLDFEAVVVKVKSEVRLREFASIKRAEIS